jgi:hypothetical protein
VNCLKQWSKACCLQVTCITSVHFLQSSYWLCCNYMMWLVL